MNMRATLMIMAATVAPVYAQAPIPAVNETYAALSATVQAPAASPDARAAVYPALAHIPADVEAFITLCDLSNMLKPCVKIITPTGGEMPEELLKLDSFALAIGSGSKEALNNLLPLVLHHYNEEEGATFGKLWSATAAEPVSSIIQKVFTDYADSLKQTLADSMPKLKLPPVYAVLSGKAGSEDMLNNWCNLAVASMQENIEPANEYEAREAVEINGYKGIKLKSMGNNLIQPGYEFNAETGTFAPKELTETDKLLQNELNKRNFYILLRQQGTNILAVICENPEDISEPADATQSVLGSDKVSAADAHLGQAPIMLGYTAPDLNAMQTKLQVAPYMGMAQQVSKVFTELAAQGGEQKTVWENAVKSADLLTSTINKWLFAEQQIPELLQMWREKSADGKESVEILFTGNSSDLSYNPGKLVLTAQADSPATIFYAESTPCNLKSLPTCTELIDAADNLATAYTSTLQPGARDAALAQLTIARNFIPEAKALCSALQTIGSGMNGSKALSIDSAGSMPVLLGGTPGNKAAVPRISFYSGVSDRAKLNEGWQQILSTASSVAVKLGSDPSVINMLPIVPTVNGSISSYNVAMPWFTPDMVPNVSVSDTGLAIGTSSNYNAEVMAAATGNMDFTGCVFSIKFDNLATTARGIANELTAVAEAEKKAAAPAVVEASPAPESTDEEEEDSYIDEEDYEEEDPYSYAYEELTPAEERASQARDIAEACENIANMVQRLDGTATTNEGRLIIRAKATLK